MRDGNDNNIDDNLEILGIVGAAAHLRNQGQQVEAARRVAQALELQAQATQEELARLAQLPQCPWCGGRIEGMFPKCMHCTSDLVWVENIPCQPAKEADLRRRLADERAQAVAENARQHARKRASEDCQRQLLHNDEKGVPTNCLRCKKRRRHACDVSFDVDWSDKRSASYFDKEISSIRTTGMCYECSSAFNAFLAEEKNKKMRLIAVTVAALLCAALGIYQAIAFIIGVTSSQ